MNTASINIDPTSPIGVLPRYGIFEEEYVGLRASSFRTEVNRASLISSCSPKSVWSFGFPD